MHDNVPSYAGHKANDYYIAVLTMAQNTYKSTKIMGRLTYFRDYNPIIKTFAVF